MLSFISAGGKKRIAVKRIFSVLVVLILALSLTGCQSFLYDFGSWFGHDSSEADSSAAEEKPAEIMEVSQPALEDSGQEDCSQPEESSEPEEPEPERKQFTIVLDPGHQSQEDDGQEPVGPGSDETKMRVSGGTQGSITGYKEYELNLQVSLMLRDELTKRGYNVIMTRETNEVWLSNIERTRIANEARADAFVRVHANGSGNPEEHGVLMLTMPPDSVYNPELYTESSALARAIQNGIIETTGAANCGIWETDTMSGINWSEVPVTILEMGFMTNAEEEQLLMTKEYQEAIVQGAANGLDQFFDEKAEWDPVSVLPSEIPLDGIRQQLDAELSTLESVWDVWLEKLETGESIHCTQNAPANARMISASIIKLFVMGTAYEQIQNGYLDEEMVAEDLYQMITISDNDATNELTAILGGGDPDAGRELVTSWARSIGCNTVQYNRLMLADNDLQNYVSAKDCARILRMIYNGECVSQEYSAKMMELLKAQYYNEYIPAAIPDEIVVAHKTGDLLIYCVADTAIVLYEDCPYILCVLCNYQTSYEGAGEEIRKLSAMVYDYLESSAAAIETE